MAEPDNRHLGELRKALGTSESYARLFAHRLVKKGWFERLRVEIRELGAEGSSDALSPVTRELR